jgi:hypothetical protein
MKLVTKGVAKWATNTMKIEQAICQILRLDAVENKTASS